jgi:outer membrane autotransporter protein
MDQSEPRSWLQEVGFGVNQTSNTSEIGYATAGFAIAAGYEQPAGKLGTVGYSAAILTSDVSDDNRAFGSKLSASALVGSFYWRKAAGGLLLDASATGAGAWFDSTRRVVDEGPNGEQNLVRSAGANYYGAMGGVRLGAAYEAKFGNFYIRPEATLDYLYLYEGGYTESGGGPSIDLKVDSRSSSNSTAEAGVVLGARFGRTFHWGPELQVAYRTTLTGSLGSTSAAFVSVPGGAFLMPALPVDKNRLLVRLALRGSGAYANFALEGSGEFGDLYDEYTGRIVVRFIF